MRVCYVLLSATWGMQQYTADLANRRAAAGDEVHVVTTAHAPADRYAPAVSRHAPIATRTAGFSPEALRIDVAGRAASAVIALRPDLVHVTGPHLWNPRLMDALHGAGLTIVHTLHELQPYGGAPNARLVRAWNRAVRRRADFLLVHGERYRQELVAAGVSPSRVARTWLTHLLFGYGAERTLRATLPSARYEPWALFLGRLEAHKGLDTLVEALWQLGGGVEARPLAVVAGPGGSRGLVRGIVPPGLEVRNRTIEDDEAADLLSRCAVVVLPYVEAGQSALIAAAYFFHKPVIVTRTGALPEYVVDGQTGWIVAPREPAALAAALRAALADPNRLEAMGRQARAWYEAQRAAEDVALAELYERARQ